MLENYIILTGAFNEEKNIERTIQSVVKQSILPKEWIIINDGSKDDTEQILKAYSKKYSWIKYFNLPNENVPFGTHAVNNFYRSFEKITFFHWQFVVKLDADLDIDKDNFFEYQFVKFKDNLKLGISSGITYSTHTGKKVLTKGRPYWRTGGAMKVYRRECFEQIGGLKPIYGWDGLDEYLAMYNGWKTRTFFELHVNHLGKLRALDREKTISLAKYKGESLYKRGYPIEFVLIKSLTYLKMSREHQKAFLKGYFSSKRDMIKQYVSAKEKSFIRKIQYLRIIDKLMRKKLL